MVFARVAQLVEHDLAKVGAAGSSPVSRSHRNTKKVSMLDTFFCVLRAQSGLEGSSDLIRFAHWVRPSRLARSLGNVYIFSSESL